MFALSAAVRLRVPSARAARSERRLAACTASPNVIGTGVSGGLPVLIGAINVVILVGIVRVFRDMRRGTYDEAELEEQLNKPRLHEPRSRHAASRAVRSPGRSTRSASSSASASTPPPRSRCCSSPAAPPARGLPFYAILCLPILFAAGMSLLDTIDGSFMNFAYGWAFSKPVRKVYYNITITGLSVAVALLIGAVELLGLLANEFNLDGHFWNWVAASTSTRSGTSSWVCSCSPGPSRW